MMQHQSDGGAGVDFRLLGPVEVWHDGERLAIGHARQRTVLAALLVDARTVVPIEVLIDRVWGHDPPDGVLSTMYAYAARLRKALRPVAVDLIGRSGGYLLDIDPHLVDAHRFRRSIAQARTARDADRVAAILDEALGLWRGVAFAGTDSPWITEQRRVFTAQRLSAAVDRNDAYLACGRHDQVVDQLLAQVAEHPVDERLTAQLMLALYRCGRPADALDQYRSLRARLVDRLGVEPGPGLRRLQRRILDGDPELVDLRPRYRRSRPVPAQLPHDTASFVGRRAELDRLDTLQAAADRRHDLVIAVIDGTAGAGKTALAVHWAHRVRERFPDGNLYADLRGFGPGPAKAPEQVLDGFLTALDVSATAVPADLDAKAALYRSLLAERRVLVILDNAATAQQVRPLLPGSSSCSVVVTSRARLTGLAVRDRAQCLSLDVLPVEDALTLLARFIGRDRIELEAGAAHELARLCARLPVALCVAGQRGGARRDSTLDKLVAELRTAGSRLDLLDADGDQETAVRAVFSWSYQALPAAAARTFRLLGLHPGPELSTSAAAALIGVDPSAAAPMLDGLAGASLITEQDHGRYLVHDLLHEYAAELAHAHDPVADRDAATERMLDHYLHVAHAAVRSIDPTRDMIVLTPPRPGVPLHQPADHAQALAWFHAEHACLTAAVDLASDTGRDRHAWQLAWSLRPFLQKYGHWQDLVVTQRAALAAGRRLGDRAAVCLAHRNLASGYISLGRFDDARTELHHALDRYRDADDRLGQAHTLLALVYLQERQGRYAEALADARTALALQASGASPVGHARALNAIGWLLGQLGRHEEALDNCRQALAEYSAIDDLDGAAASWDSIGCIQQKLECHDRAVESYRHALNLYRRLGIRYSEATVLTHLGDTRHVMGDHRAARAAWRKALAVLTELGHHDAEVVDSKLRDLDAMVASSDPGPDRDQT